MDCGRGVCGWTGQEMMERGRDEKKRVRDGNYDGKPQPKKQIECGESRCSGNKSQKTTPSTHSESKREPPSTQQQRPKEKKSTREKDTHQTAEAV